MRVNIAGGTVWHENGSMTIVRKKSRISQGSVATCLTYGGIFSSDYSRYYTFIAELVNEYD